MSLLLWEEEEERVILSLFRTRTCGLYDKARLVVFEEGAFSQRQRRMTQLFLYQWRESMMFIYIYVCKCARESVYVCGWVGVYVSCRRTEWYAEGTPRFGCVNVCCTGFPSASATDAL